MAQKGKPVKTPSLESQGEDNDCSDQKPKLSFNIKSQSAFSENGIIVRPLAINSLNNASKISGDNLSENSVNAASSGEKEENRSDSGNQNLEDAEPSRVKDSASEEATKLKRREESNSRLQRERGYSKSPRRSKKKEKQKEEKQSRKQSKDRGSKRKHRERSYSKNRSRNRSRSSESLERKSSEKHVKSSRKRKSEKDRRPSDRKGKIESGKRSKSRSKSRSRSHRRDESKPEMLKKVKKEKHSKHSRNESKQKSTKKDLSDELSDLKSLLNDDEPSKNKSAKKDKKMKEKQEFLMDVMDSEKNFDNSRGASECLSKSISGSDKRKADRSADESAAAIDDLEITIVNDRLKDEESVKVKKTHQKQFSFNDSKLRTSEKSDEKHRRKRKMGDNKSTGESSGKVGNKVSESDMGISNDIVEEKTKISSFQVTELLSKRDSRQPSLSEVNSNEEMDYDLVFMKSNDETIELRKPIVEKHLPETQENSTKSARNSLSFVPKQVKSRQKDNVETGNRELSQLQADSSMKETTELCKVEMKSQSLGTKLLDSDNPEKLVANQVLTKKVSGDGDKIDFKLSESSDGKVDASKRRSEENFSHKKDGSSKTVNLSESEVNSDDKASAEKRLVHSDFPVKTSRQQSVKSSVDANESPEQRDRDGRKTKSKTVTKRSKSPSKTSSGASLNKNTKKAKTDKERSYQRNRNSYEDKKVSARSSKEDSKSRSGSYRKEDSHTKYPPRDRRYHSRSRSTSYNSYKRLRRDLSRSRSNERSPFGKRKPDRGSSRTSRDLFSNKKDRRYDHTSDSRSGDRAYSRNETSNRQLDRIRDRDRNRGSFDRRYSRSYSSSSTSSSRSRKDRSDSSNVKAYKAKCNEKYFNTSGLENISSQSTLENSDTLKLSDKQRQMNTNEKTSEEQSDVTKQHQEDPQWTAVSDLCPIKTDPNRGEPIHSIVSQPPPEVPLNFIPNVLPSVVAEEFSGSKAVRKMVDEKVQCWSDSKKVSIDQWLERSATIPNFDPSQFATGLQNAAAAVQRLNQPISSLPPPPPNMIPPNFSSFVQGAPNAPPPPSTLPFPMPPFIPSFLPPPQFISSLNTQLKPGFLQAGIPSERKREENEKSSFSTSSTTKMSIEESNKLFAELEKMKHSRAAAASNADAVGNKTENQATSLRTPTETVAPVPHIPPQLVPLDHSAGFQQLVQSILPEQSRGGLASSKALLSGVSLEASKQPTPPAAEPLKPNSPPPMPSPSYSPSLSPVEKREKKTSKKDASTRKASQGAASVTKSSDQGKSPLASKAEKGEKLAVELPSSTTANTMQGTLQNLQELLLNIKGAANLNSTVEPTLRTSPAVATNSKRKSAFDMGEEVMVPLGLELSEFTPPRMGEDDSTPTPSNTEKLKDLEKLFPPTAASTASSISPVKKLTDVKTTATSLVKSSSSVVDQKKIFQDKVAASAKKYLKPHFVKGKVTKDQYKHIMRRVVNKCTEGVKTYEVKQDKVRKLVESYVSHMGQSKSGSKH